MIITSILSFQAGQMSSSFAENKNVPGIKFSFVMKAIQFNDDIS